MWCFSICWLCYSKHSCYCSIQVSYMETSKQNHSKIYASSPEWSLTVRVKVPTALLYLVLAPIFKQVGSQQYRLGPQLNRIGTPVWGVHWDSSELWYHTKTPSIEPWYQMTLWQPHTWKKCEHQREQDEHWFLSLEVIFCLIYELENRLVYCFEYIKWASTNDPYQQHYILAIRFHGCRWWCYIIFTKKKKTYQDKLFLQQPKLVS